MKIIKPQTLSLLTRPFEFKREFWLGISVIAFLPIGDAPVLLPETELWPFLTEELPPEQPLDVAIPKAQPEFLAIAHAFAPGGVAAPKVSTGIQLGDVIKMLDVFGDRRLADGRLTEPAVFRQMPLDWAHSYGGPEFADNPLGKGAAPLNGPKGGLFDVPNVVYPQLADTPPRPGPAGYGPIDQMWPARIKRTGTHDDTWLHQDFPGFARDMDWRFFNTAPADQWFSKPLIGDETYAFKNLHPEFPLLQGRLPGLAPRLFLVRKGALEGFEEVSLVLTTLWCFPHRERLVLVHHGRARLAEEDASDIARITLGADALGAPRPAADFHAVMTLRADSKDGAMSALRDADLVPPSWLRPDPALAMPDPETSSMARIFARNRKNMAAKHAEAVAMVKAQGLDPDKYVQPLPPPRKIPTLDELPAFVAAVEEEAAAEMAKAEQAIAAKKQGIAAQLAATGLSPAEIEQKLSAKPKGPPAFSAAAVRKDIQGQITAMRVLGQLTMALEAQLASPAFSSKLAEAEAGVRNAYRLAAHLQDPADAAQAGRSAEIRKLLADNGAAARAQYDLQGADLSGLDLHGIDLSGVCLDGANLTGTSFANAKLTDAVLAHARMQGCVLDGADLNGATLGKAKLTGASLRGTHLRKSVLAGADLTRACLAGADLEGADLSEAIFFLTDLTQVRAPGILAMKLCVRGLRAPGILLDRAKFLECDLTGADLSGASLHRAVFLKTKLAAVNFAAASMCKAVFVQQCDLSHADLSGADLTETNLRETTMHSAILNGARLEKADLSGADLTEAQLANVRADDSRMVAAILRGADLRRGCFARVDFARADLRGTDLTGASVYAANLARVQLGKHRRTGGMLRAKMRYLPVYEPPVER